MNIFGYNLPNIFEEFIILLLPFTNSFALLTATIFPKFKDLYNIHDAHFGHIYTKVIFDTITIFGILLNTIQVSFKTTFNILSLTLFGLFFLFVSFVIPSIFLPYFLDTGIFKLQNSVILSFILLFICSLIDLFTKNNIHKIKNFIDKSNKKIIFSRLLYYPLLFSLLFIPFVLGYKMNNLYSYYTNNIYRTLFIFIFFFSFFILIEQQIIQKSDKMNKKHKNYKNNMKLFEILKYLPSILLILIFIIFYTNLKLE